MPGNPVLTTERIFLPGDSLRGSEGSYYRLTDGAGEPHVGRFDLAPQGPANAPGSLLFFAHLTDIHTVDTQSPGRFEFLQRFSSGSEVYRDLAPAHRPQEALHLQATAQMIHTLNDIPESTRTAQPLQLVVVTGDSVDNKQTNELQWFVTLMEGGRVDPQSGGLGYEGVQSAGWDFPAYWHPDAVSDFYKERWGFPDYPGLLDEATRPFDAEGLRLPWLSLYGNHDALILGTAIPDSTYDAIATGPSKAVALPANLEPDIAVRQFVWEPSVLLGGPTRAITRDDERRSMSRQAFIEAHLNAAGTPPGHGFTPDNGAGGRAYYAYDPVPEIRMVMLDTTNPGGYYQGSIGLTQFRWLEQCMIEAQSRYFSADGTTIYTGHADRLIVICSHHDSTSLTNGLTGSPASTTEDEDRPRVLGPELEALLHRFPNVILWINGHTHRHAVRPHAGRHAAGFWEITTGSLLDWPCQARLIEILDNGDGSVSVLCTMLDYNAPARAGGPGGVEVLATIHRELAANDPDAGMKNPLLCGRPLDRNVELFLRNPCVSPASRSSADHGNLIES